MATNNIYQNSEWSIRPCDLDALTRFCPENETSLLNMNIQEDKTKKYDSFVPHKSMNNLVNPVATDSGFGSQELSDGKMKGVKKNQSRPGSGRGRAQVYTHEDDKATEKFINRQIQDVLRNQEGLENYEKTSKTGKSLRNETVVPE